MSDWGPTIKQKALDSKDYRGSVNVPMGEESFSLPYKLLPEPAQLELQGDIEMASLAEKASENDVSPEVEAAEQTVRELQEKDDDLTDEEEQSLQDAQITLMQNKAEVIDAMGKDTFKAFYRAGKRGIFPDNEDIEAVMDTSPAECRERFGDLDTVPKGFDATVGSEVPDVPTTRTEAKVALKAEMLSILEGTPFLIFFTIGQTVWEESQSAGKLVDGSDS